MKLHLHGIAGVAFGLLLLLESAAHAQRQMEPLGRGMLALRRTTSQAYVSWRLLATDPENVGFNLYRSANGAAGVKLNATLLTNTTDYFDSGANFGLSNAWYVRPVVNGVEQAPGAPAGLPANAPIRNYVPLPLQPVSGGAFPPYDVKFAWVGDLNGDGEYDFVVDRLSTVAATNQYLQAYLRDGTLLWQMDLGHNSVNQYAHEPGSSAISIGMGDCVTVYDMDGDGRAEVMVRTANGVTVTNAAGVRVASITAANDLIQYMTVLDGLTGAVRDSKVIPNPYSVQGPIFGHMGIMYCDGVRPSVLYQGWNRNDSPGGDEHFNLTLTTWDFRDGVLTQRWWWERGYHPMGEGHQIRIADVDGDGKDEFCEIGFTVDDNGTTLFNTELAHGDRFHIMDVDPDRPGLETFAIQQNNTTLLATGLYDSRTGQFVKKWYSGGVVDVGRGLAMDYDPRTFGCEMYSTQPGTFDRQGNQISAGTFAGTPPEGLWWDGDLLRETVDGPNAEKTSPVVNKPNYAGLSYSRLYSIYNEGVHQAYGGRPAFWGDLLGDWREEIVLVANDYSEIRIYCTTNAAQSRLYCLMQNPAYRMQATCKGYYQGCYTDYHLGLGMQPPPPAPTSSAQLVWRGNSSGTWDTSTANWFTNNLWISNNTPTTFASASSVLFDLSSTSTTITLAETLSPGEVTVNSPTDYTFSGSGALTGTMKLAKAGRGRLTLTGTNSYTGATTIWEGPLVVNGSLSASLVIVRGGLWLEGALAGTGFIAQGVTAHRNASLSPGAGLGSPGTLTISNGVTLAGQAYCRLDLSANAAGSNDLLNILGNLTTSGTNYLYINPLTATLASDATYPLINYSGTFNGALSNFVVLGLPGIPVLLTNPPGQIALRVPGHRAPATINWTGGSSGNVWDLLNSTNFLNGAAKDRFAPGDTVRFDSIGTSNLTATLVGSLNPASVIVDSTASYTLTGGGGILGSAGLLKSNTGTLTLTASNSTFTGRTVIAGGTVVVTDVGAAGFPSALGSASAHPTNLLLAGSATLRVTGESYTDRGITLGAGGTNSLDIASPTAQLTVAGLITGSGALQKLGAGTLALSRSNQYTGVTILKAGLVSLGGDAANQYAFGANGTGTVILDGGTINQFDAADTYNGLSWTVNVPAGATGTINADSRIDWYGSLTGAGTFNLFVPYVRTTLLGNWSGFAGQINVTTDSDGGDFRVSNSAGYGNAILNLGPRVYAYHTSSSSTINVGALAGAAGAVLSGGVWNVGSRNTNSTFAGNITGTAITKGGSGTWTLTGTNSYSGPTTINSGILMVNGNNAPAKGNVIVNATGILAGLGSIGGNVTVNGRLAPGNNGIGTLTCTNNVTFNAGGVALIEINRSSGTRDLLSVGGTLTCNGTLQVTNLSGTLVAGDSFKIFDAAAYLGSFSTLMLPPLGPGLAWTNQLSVSGTIAVISVPVATPPVFTSAIRQGSNLILSGSNGSPNTSYYVLSSTNVTLPPAAWARTATNQFNASGTFHLTNPVDPAVSQQFYRLQLP